MENKFQRAAAPVQNGKGMETEKVGSPQLEDFRPHYRQYSRSQGPKPPAPMSGGESDRELLLDTWKEQFLPAVFRATNCFMSHL